MSHRIEGQEELFMVSDITEADIPKRKKRFLILFLFCLCSIINAIGWISYAPIQPVLKVVSPKFKFFLDI
jgi:hypothetical protein